MMTEGSPSDLHSVVRRVLRQAEAAYPDRAHRVWDVWEQAVGSAVAARCHPISLRSGRLLVGAVSSAWLQQLTFLKESIQDSVNGALGENLVRDVRFRIAEAEPAPRRVGPAKDPAPLPPLPDSTLRAIDRELEAISDEEVRRAVRRLRVRAERERQVRAVPEGEGPPENTAPPRRGE